MSNTEKILILGGTKEAVQLANKMVKQGYDVTTSLAGRTKKANPIAGKIRIGGFSKEFVTGAIGLAEYLEDGCFDKLIDATHPFAEQISENAKIASHMSGVPLEIVKREPWRQKTDDIWHVVENLEEARDAIPLNAKVLLALGSQHIALFSERFDVEFLVRMIDEPKESLDLPKHKLLLARPSNDVSEEIQLLKDYNITHIVCRNSGGDGAYAKIKAARELKLPVIIISQS